MIKQIKCIEFDTIFLDYKQKLNFCFFILLSSCSHSLHVFILFLASDSIHRVLHMYIWHLIGHKECSGAIRQHLTVFLLFLMCSKALMQHLSLILSVCEVSITNVNISDFHYL